MRFACHQDVNIGMLPAGGTSPAYEAEPSLHDGRAHGRHTRARRADDDRPDAADHPTPTGPAGLLALQQLAGNRAVAGAVADPASTGPDRRTAEIATLKAARTRVPPELRRLAATCKRLAPTLTRSSPPSRSTASSATRWTPPPARRSSPDLITFCEDLVNAMGARISADTVLTAA